MLVLKDFTSVKNQIIDSNSNGYGTELKDIIETIEKQLKSNTEDSPYHLETNQKFINKI